MIWDGRVTQVFLNPNSPAEVYATFWNNLTGYDLYYSKDGGENFNDITPKSITTLIKDFFERMRKIEIEIESVSYVALNPHNPQQLFVVASARWAGADIYTFLLKSSDKGQSWQVLLDKTNVKSLAFHPNNKDVIYAVIQDKETGGNPDTEKLGDKILKSIDGGKNWINIATPYSKEISNIAELHSDRRYLYVDISDIGLAPPDVLYVATNYGIYKTVNDGTNWEPKSFGLPVSRGAETVLEIDINKKIYISGALGYDGGYWVSSDEGLTWEWHFGPGKKQRCDLSSKIRRMITTPGQIKYIDSREDAFKLTPDGKYSKIKIPFPHHHLGVSPSSSQIIYAVAIDRYYAINYPGILLKSEDSGFSWIEIDWKKWLPPERLERGRWYEITLLSVDPQSPNNLYVAVGPEDKRSVILKTLDGGNSWNVITPYNFDIPNSIVIDPFDSNVLYACTDYNLLRSTDGGKTWKSIEPKVDYLHVNNIAINPLNPKLLYLATDKGIYRSFDSGKTWQPLNNGLLDTAIDRIIASSYMILAEGKNGIYKLMEE
jgi:photosystem II stability/assembly factor-like uncharacterized protein